MLSKLRKLTTLLAIEHDNPDAHVHFHQGSEGRPAACHDPRCPNPRLTI
jgi:hypothetical protein